MSDTSCTDMLWAAFVCILVTIFLSGCATNLELHKELESRNVLPLEVGPQLGLANISFVRLESWGDAAGTAHLAGIDSERQVHHIAVDPDGKSKDEVIGRLSPATEIFRSALDIVEYPVGTIRIAAGDIEFERPIADSQWTRFSGNRCRKYLVRQGSLYCAFVANGTEAQTTARTDTNIVLLIILPIVWQSTANPDKLVLAERIDSHWIVRAVVDSADDWSADEEDLAVAVDQHDMLNMIFRARRGGSMALIVFGPGGGGLAGKGPETEARYVHAPFPVEDSGGVTRNNWQEMYSQSRTLTWNLNAQGICSKKSSINCDRQSVNPPLSRHVSVSPVEGNVIALLQNGLARYGFGIISDAGQTFEYLVVDGFPSNVETHVVDRGALLRVTPDGLGHLLASACSIGWTSMSCNMVYVRRDSDSKLGAVVIDSEPGTRLRETRTLASFGSGIVFVTWASKGDQLVGRWIRSAKESKRQQ